MNVRLKPWTSDTITITVATPMMMPRQVRNERSFCAATARSAVTTFSRQAAASLSQRPIQAPTKEVKSEELRVKS